MRKELYECMDKMLGFEDHLKANIVLDSYDKANYDFGSRIAIESRKSYKLVDAFWEFNTEVVDVRPEKIPIFSTRAK